MASAVTTIALATAISVPVSLVSLIVAISVVATLVIITAALVMGHGDRHGFRRHISGGVCALNRDRVHSAAAVP